MVYASRSQRSFICLAAVLVLLIVAPSLSFAQSNEAENEKGYHDCTLQHIEACQNTNQMFFGLRGPGLSGSYNKPELPAAIERFLRGAPTIRDLGHTFSASEIAQESLHGPGKRFHFPGGEWLFTGFTPHEADDQAAILFDAAGEILLIATLGPDLNVPPKTAYGGYPQNLTIYLHTAVRDGKYVEHVVHWARDSISDRNANYSDLPKDEMGIIKIVTASKDQRHWSTHVLK